MKLLNPKVVVVKREYLTEKQLLSLLKKLKQKKYGFKEYAVDVEEVIVTKEIVITHYYKSNSMYGRKGDISGSSKIKPGNYFNLHLEYITV